MTLASNRLVFSASSFLALHNFLASLLIDSNRVPIQAVSYKLYSAKSVSLLAIGVLAETKVHKRPQYTAGHSVLGMPWVHLPHKNRHLRGSFSLLS